MEVKENCNMINSPSFLGYTRLGAETTALKTDLREVSITYLSASSSTNQVSNLISEHQECEHGKREIHSGSG
jgi:hypothetical protein